MPKTSVQIECQFVGEETIQRLLLEAFQLYLSRMLDRNHGGAVSCS